MQGSTRAPPAASPQSLLKMRPERRPAPLASLSFPSKPPGPHQLWHLSHAAIQSWGQLDECQITDTDLFNHHHQPQGFVVPSLVHTTVDEEEAVAQHGSQSFTFPYSNRRINLSSTSVAIQPPGGIQLAHFSNSLAHGGPCQNPVYSARFPLATPYHRSLTSSQNFLNDEMMTTTTVPNSPPDLSRSKSSKSSSFQSSQFDSPDGITNDVSNFEEIGLDADTHDHCLEIAAWEQNGFAKRSRSREPSIAPQLVMPARDLTASDKRPTYPSLQGQVQYALTSKSAEAVGLPRNGGAAGEGLRRGFTAPPIATLPMAIPGCQPRTRSSSPSPKQPASASFATMGYNVRSGLPSRSAAPPSRRGSWQPSRKTIKELEAEYHDSDDELPDDMSLWNVPVSPRPPTARPSSTRSSNRGSPERSVASDAPRPIPLSHAVSTPESPALQSSSQSLPRNQPPLRTTSLQRTTSTGNSPSSPKARASFRDTRAKSWNFAMAELSEEARVLTETLEFHSDHKGRLHEEDVQNGVKSSRPSLEANARRSARSSATELPPIQKGNILIDPMPLSKEKEAVLTRTRPSWLPPKDPKEEKRHMKEYQRMMAASLDAERKKENKTRARQCEKDNTREALNRIWEEYVCPDWERVTHEHRTRELWWRGVSPQARGQVWMRAVGNPLGLTNKSYPRALQRVKDLQARAAEDLTEKERSMRAWFLDVERDAKFAFPQLNLFQKHGPMWRELVDVCCAYVSYRSDMGYVYGIQVSHSKVASSSTANGFYQLIAALMLLQLPSPADVFVLLANCLNGPLALAFLTNDPGSTTKTLQHASSTLLYKSPRLHDYLFRSLEDGGLAMHSSHVFEAIFRTLLTNGLDVERLVRVWDCFVFEGDRIIVRAAVALLDCLQTQIFGFEGSPHEKRRMIRHLLSWGPTGRLHGYWDVRGDADSFMRDVWEAGKINPTEE
jgi:Rab-GTPase-TBC domain